VEPDRLKIVFAISQTANPDDFKTYITASAHRKR
jgi:hypothetical protein